MDKETNIHFITYATHSEGIFDKLIKNDFNIEIKVLGWGEKWKGFMDKFNNMYVYIQTLPDNDIVIFIDGFDSKINQSKDKIKKTFLEFNSDIVLSKDSLLPGPLGTFTKSSFGTCKNNITANSGLYAGYNKNIKELIKHILDKNYSSDDQRNLNYACKDFNNIKIDTDKKLFHNLNYYERYFNNKSEACFTSTPGDLTFNRLSRVPGEYLPFIWKELILVIFIIIIIYYIKKNKLLSFK